MVVHLQRDDASPPGPDRGDPAGPDHGVPVPDRLVLEPGQTAGVSGIPGAGLTRIGMSLLVPHAAGGQLAYLDVRGWFNPASAWEMGVSPDRLVVVRCSDLITWGRVGAALLTGVRGVFAEVPAGIRDPMMRKLAARARTTGTPLVLRPLSGAVPSGVAHLRLEVHATAWEGAEAGHGHIISRRTVLEASGKAIRGMRRTIEVEDDGTHDLRVVSHVGPGETRRLA